MPHLTLTKHHGLGNDFLIAATVPAGIDLAALARRVCDRRRGIGADGLLAWEPGEPARMVLHNSDGSRAEMSGNGIRCLVQAMARHLGLHSGSMRIDTDAGVRDVTFAPTDDPATITASVAMGEVTAIAAPSSWPALGVDPMRPVAHLALGNPHAVLLTDDVSAVDVAVLGARVPEVNLELIEAGPEPDAITMRVHERGAGVTEACGTGACAAAFAARAWGLYGGEAITVHMDGGDARVEFGPGDQVTLVGPATLVATIEIKI